MLFIHIFEKCIDLNSASYIFEKCIDLNSASYIVDITGFEPSSPYSYNVVTTAMLAN
jgi:hypothetical protein